MVAERRKSLTDDLISELIRAEDDGDRLTTTELRMLAAGILMAGTDTTRNQLAAAVDILCDHPEQWELLAEHPELAMNAVEELMRFYPVIFGAMRMTIEDVEIEGVSIPAGTFVLVNTAAGNRDPEVFDDPHRLDITRKGAAPMQTFGAGAHYCLGANLARRELAEALVVMTRRMSNVRRAGARGVEAPGGHHRPRGRCRSNSTLASSPAEPSRLRWSVATVRAALRISAKAPTKASVASCTSLKVWSSDSTEMLS